MSQLDNSLTILINQNLEHAKYLYSGKILDMKLLQECYAILIVYIIIVLNML